ncbi:DUF1624 domain-containing protein [Novosphingobium umbonatum]|uniref:DUF1624 domain-containing protein n=1 Tax=Novosphingobium umbonatum TaxID=1908524 RepID=A0A3S2V7M7_9SPHN|nr:heparan-alpha-glucosaminide N-acetyltransferase domain-containing protein [Novosphingobium umbonatum]RVU05707.1 DUF1624 domain-containing protein [Novosphingobium umbonatum]
MSPPTSNLSQPSRLLSIDALRGLVMVFMLVDHVRETFFLHLQVSDPVDAHSVEPGLFFTRLLSSFCAPVFVALTGLSAWLYGQSHSKGEVSAFLVKRGLFLLALELSVVAYAWVTQANSFPPSTIWLQVMWAIGVSMLCLALLIHAPRGLLLPLGLGIVGLHNLLDPVHLVEGQAGFVPFALLHQRSVIHVTDWLTIKTTYPVLPWIGVILLGYAIGPWFARGSDGAIRRHRLTLLGGALLTGFVLLRGINLYGDKPWFWAETPLRTVMSFLALTKYPPSLLFLMPTLGAGCLLLAWFEKLDQHRLMVGLAQMGGAPLFFYIVHLYALKLLYNLALALYGPVKGRFFGVDYLSTVWLWVLVLLVALYGPTRWFAGFKQRRRDLGFLKYF